MKFAGQPVRSSVCFGNGYSRDVGRLGPWGCLGIDRAGFKTILKGNETISSYAEIILENAGII